MRRSRPARELVTFLESPVEREKARVMILGIPFEEAAVREGTTKGPAAVREASRFIETYSPYFNRTTASVLFYDDGNLTIGKATISSIAKKISERLPGSVRPIFLGGDQCITIAAVKSLLDRGENFELIHLDARPDSLDSHKESRWSGRSAIRRIKDFFRGDIYQLGIRTAEAQEYAYATEANQLYLADRFVEGLTAVEKQCQGKNVYLSFNINVMDPSLCPGTPAPVSGGFLSDQVRLLINTLKEFNVIGMDLVGVAPEWDPSGLTAIVAAEIVRDAMLAFWG